MVTLCLMIWNAPFKTKTEFQCLFLVSTTLLHFYKGRTHFCMNFWKMILSLVWIYLSVSYLVLFLYFSLTSYFTFNVALLHFPYHPFLLFKLFKTYFFSWTTMANLFSIVAGCILSNFFSESSSNPRTPSCTTLAFFSLFNSYATL